MDFSGMGALLIGCCYIGILPLLLARFLVYFVLWIRLLQGGDLSFEQGDRIFKLLYGSILIVSCALTYYFYLQYVYVM